MDDQPLSDQKRSRHAFDLFVEDAIESYKDSISRIELLQIGDEAIKSILARLPDANRNHESWVDTLGEHPELLLPDEVDRIISERLRLPQYEDWRRQQSVATEVTPALLDLHGRPIRGVLPERITVVAREIDERLLRALQEQPRRVHELTPRKFEYLIAELLTRDGWDVELTPVSRDGGKDIIARLRTSGVDSVYYVECKRYAAERPVSVKVVRELLGVIHADRVTAGIVVTTSSFSRPAVDLQRDEAHRLTLKAYDDVARWLGQKD